MERKLIIIKTLQKTSPLKEVRRGAQRGWYAPRLLALLGFPPPASPRWGEIQDGGHVAVMFLLCKQVSYFR